MSSASRRVVATTLFCLAVSGGWPASASAHATFVSMSPGDGSVVQQAPSQVVLTFDQPLQDIGTAVVVRAPSGASVVSGSPSVLDNTVTQQLVPLTEPGTYSVAYRVTSTDGHPISQERRFSFKTVSAVSSSPPPTDVGASAGSAASAWIGAAVVLGILGVVAALAVAGRRRRSLVGADIADGDDPGPDLEDG